MGRLEIVVDWLGGIRAALTAVVVVASSGCSGGSIPSTAAFVRAPSVDGSPQPAGVPTFVPQSSPTPHPPPATTSAPTATPPGNAPTVPAREATSRPTNAAIARPTNPPTTAPSASVPAAPVAAAGAGCWNSVQNGQDWPANCVLYGPNSPWNRPITNPDSPKLFPNGDSLLRTVVSNIIGPGISSMWASKATVKGISDGDGGTVPYVAKASDPLVTYACRLYCGGTLLNSGVQFHVPAGAHPDLTGDKLFSVVQPNGDEYDCWLTSDGVPWSNGSALTAGGCSAFTNMANSTGWVPGAIADDTIRTNSLSNGAASTSGAALAATAIRASELIAGHINHALGAASWCSSGFVYPASHYDNLCPFLGGIPDGARLWSDLTDGQVNSNPNLNNAEKTILIALHHYGVYLRDSNGNVAQQRGAFSMYIEGAVVFYSYGQQNPAFTYGQSNGWTYLSSVDRAIFGDDWAPNVPGGIWSHMHIVDTCYAAATC